MDARAARLIAPDRAPEDPRFQRYVVARVLPLSKVLDRAGVEYIDRGTFYCPFHDDASGSHPSAKFFRDATGEHVFCFSERKQYDSWLAVELLLRDDPRRVFRKLWAKLTVAQRTTLEQEFGSRGSALPEGWEGFVEAYGARFKRGKISVARLLRGLESLLTAPPSSGQGED